MCRSAKDDYAPEIEGENKRFWQDQYRLGYSAGGAARLCGHLAARLGHALQIVYLLVITQGSQGLCQNIMDRNIVGHKYSGITIVYKSIIHWV